MKILFVSIGLGGGGAEKLISDLMPMLNGHNGISCELLILTDKEEKYLDILRNNGVKVYIANKRNAWQEILFLNRVIQKGNYDIIHAHLFRPTYYCSLIKKLYCFKKSKCPKFVVTEHNTDNRRRHKKYLRSIEKWIYNSYDKILSISKGTEDSLKRWIQADDSRFVTVYNGIDLRNFLEAREYKREDILLNCAEGDILLCMIGRFSKQKNHTFMIEVMGRLPHKYKLILLGEGGLETEIKEYVHEKNLKDRVLFIGFRNDVAEIIKTSDIVVIPSLWEGFGLIAVEALACGKQVVCSDVSGLFEVVGSVGIRVKTGDIDGFADAIKKATGKLDNKDIAVECIKQAQKFDISMMEAGYLDVYKRLSET